MTERDREAFEREMHKMRPSISFHRYNDGDYDRWPIQMAWIAWQAALAYARATDAAPQVLPRDEGRFRHFAAEPRPVIQPGAEGELLPRFVRKRDAAPPTAASEEPTHGE